MPCSRQALILLFRPGLLTSLMLIIPQNPHINPSIVLLQRPKHTVLGRVRHSCQRSPPIQSLHRRNWPRRVYLSKHMAPSLRYRRNVPRSRPGATTGSALCAVSGVSARPHPAEVIAHPRAHAHLLALISSVGRDDRWSLSGLSWWW